MIIEHSGSVSLSDINMYEWNLKVKFNFPYKNVQLDLLKARKPH